jgi:hypothetical protein
MRLQAERRAAPLSTAALSTCQGKVKVDEGKVPNDDKLDVDWGALAWAGQQARMAMLRLGGSRESTDKRIASHRHQGRLGRALGHFLNKGKMWAVFMQQAGQFGKSGSL